MMAVAAGSTKLRSTPTAMEEDWALRHRTIMEADCEVVKDDCPAPSLCASFGRCVCNNSVGGPERLKFRRAFLRILKETFPPNSSLRGHLVSGGAVANLTATTTEGEPLSMLLHVGLQYLSPFQSTFQELVVTPDLAELEFNPKRLYLKVLQMATLSIFTTCFTSIPKHVFRQVSCITVPCRYRAWSKANSSLNL